MVLATGNVINRENAQGIDNPFGVLFYQTIGYILVDPDDMTPTEYWVYEEGKAPPTREVSRKRVEIPKGLFPYLYGVSLPRGLTPGQTLTLTAQSVPIVYGVDPLTGFPVQTGLGTPVTMLTPIPIGPILAQIYDPVAPMSECSDSRNTYPLPGMDNIPAPIDGLNVARPFLASNSYIKIVSSAPILLSAKARAQKKPARIAVVIGGWRKSLATVSISDIGGWSTDG